MHLPLSRGDVVQLNNVNKMLTSELVFRWVACTELLNKTFVGEGVYFFRHLTVSVKFSTAGLNSVAKKKQQVLGLGSEFRGPLWTLTMTVTTTTMTVMFTVTTRHVKR